MNLDFSTTFIITCLITGTISLATFLFSFSRKENHHFIWAAMAGALFSVSFFLANFRDIIPDFFSIILFNLFCVLAQLSYCELYCRLLSVFPRRRILLLLLPLFQVTAFIWYTYYEPSFAARVIILNIVILITCIFIVSVLIKGAEKSQLRMHIFASTPFMIMGIIGIYRITLFMVAHNVGAPSFTSPANILINLVYLMSAVWATLSAIFLISYRLQHTLAETARHDSLTSVLNRRAMRESFKREIALSMRSGDPLSLIISDIDFFKKINDTYGHVTGDAVLLHTVNVFKKCIRTTDLLARYGGEEFAFVLPKTDRANARHLGERLRAAVKNTPFEYGPESIAITCSFGIASFNPEHDDYEGLIQRADSALYEAKKNGRDRVISLL